MADLGARVVKIEPPGGDSMRYIQRQPYSPEGKSQMNGQVLDHGFTLGESAASAHTLAATHTHTHPKKASAHAYTLGWRPPSRCPQSSCCPPLPHTHPTNTRASARAVQH